MPPQIKFATDKRDSMGDSLAELQAFSGTHAIHAASFSMLDAVVHGMMESSRDLSLDVAPIDTFEDAAADASYDAIFDNSPLTPVLSSLIPISRVSSLEPKPAPSSKPIRPPAPALRHGDKLPAFKPPPSSTAPSEVQPSTVWSTRPCASSSKRPCEIDDNPVLSARSPQHSPKKTRADINTHQHPASVSDPRAHPAALPTRVARKHKANHEHRRLKRIANRSADPNAGRPTKADMVRMHVAPAQPLTAKYSVDEIPCASTGYVALRDTKGRVYTLHELVNDLGFEVIKADRNQPPRPILDKNGLVVAVIVGAPKDPGWDAVHTAAHKLLQEAAQRCNVQKASKANRRGNFAALNVGIAFGNGLQVPGNLKHNTVNAEELKKLLKSEPFVRIAGYASSAFRTWAPNLHTYYGDNLDNLIQHHPNLKRNFSHSVWASAAFNLGPRTVTAKHRDCQNLPFGWCGITALGNYDYTLGGHVVFWELKLVVEFPPGFTVLLPSAAVAHSNTPIQPHETRTSFTQFSAGGVFRWVQHGFQKEGSYTKGFQQEDWDRMAAENAERCALGTKLFSTLEELKATHQAHGKK